MPPLPHQHPAQHAAHDEHHPRGLRKAERLDGLSAADRDELARLLEAWGRSLDG